MKTRRILLKKFSKDDINLIIDLDGDSDVMKYITLGKARSFNEIKKSHFQEF